MRYFKNGAFHTFRVSKQQTTFSDVDYSSAGERWIDPGLGRSHGHWAALDAARAGVNDGQLLAS